jgi:hypothetical protein
MKDFKKMPKMACGGGVKKMQAGGSSTDDDIMEAIRSGRAKPVPMPSGRGNPEGVDIPGMGRVKPVPMPSGRGNPEGVDIPGVGRVKPVPMPKTRGEAMLLKKGGKVKRGNKKK